MSSLIEIAKDAIDFVPSATVNLFKVFPVGATPPEFNELEGKINYTKPRHIKLFCVNDLTEQEKENLEFMIPSTSFEFVTTKHPEYSKYNHIKDNFDLYVKYHYPPEEGVIGIIGID